MGNTPILPRTVKSRDLRDEKDADRYVGEFVKAYGTVRAEFDALDEDKQEKYIKIMMGNGGYPMSSVWGFVVNVDDDPKFKKGDILYPAGWATPARNKARGNIIEGNFDWVQWTGPAYLN